ncbi:hypothetical protein AB0K40_45550 [Nonomuraea bangladeshensis]|uniref:Uncharacterized protein n=1 Tax=Nonomuraea bangladeshensis TaxID=404385 RepID=A0ABV3HK50_9ACTN
MAVNMRRLGLGDEQVRELVKFASAACVVAQDEQHPLNWALEFFDAPEALIETGVKVWDLIDDKYGRV